MKVFTNCRGLLWQSSLLLFKLSLQMAFNKGFIIERIYNGIITYAVISNVQAFSSLFTIMTYRLIKKKKRKKITILIFSYIPTEKQFLFSSDFNFTTSILLSPRLIDRHTYTSQFHSKLEVPFFVRYTSLVYTLLLNLLLI